MPQIPGTVIAAKVTTGDTANTFPVADQSEIAGGLHSVQGLTDRDAIPSERRVEGMRCYVSDTQQEFQLVGGTNNGNWVDVASSTAQELYSTTVLAWTGTATANAALSAASAGTNLAYQALQTAWSGTSGVNEVFPIAVAGTNLAYQALQTAWTGTAQVAVEAGTRAAADAALQAEIDALSFSGSVTSDVGYKALQTAWSGTAGVSQAIQIADTGTNFGLSGMAGVNQVFPIAVAGTNLGYVALQTAWSGTAGVNQTLTIAVSGSVTANLALALAQTLSAVIAAGATGTNVGYIAQTSNARQADMKTTVVAGVISQVLGSRFNYEDFDRYPLGIVGQGTGDLGLMTSWNGTGVIFNQPPNGSPIAFYGSNSLTLGFFGSDSMSAYVSGTNNTGIYAGGAFWSGPGAIEVPYASFSGEDMLQSYGTGSNVPSNYFSAGTGWAAASTIYNYGP